MHTTNQPMGLGALFDEAIDIYCGHFRTLITIAAVLLPLALFQLISLVLFGSDRGVNMIKNGLVLPFASGALMVATVALRAGQSVSPGERLLAILPRTLKLVGGSVPDALSAGVAALALLGVILMASLDLSRIALAIMLAIMLGALFAQMRLNLTFASAALEDLDLKRAARRSWQLTRAQGWRVLAVLVTIGLLFVLALGPGYLIDFSRQDTWGKAARILLSSCGQVLLLPFQCAVYALLHQDLQARQEQRNAPPTLASDLA